MLFGRDNVIAEFKGSYSMSYDFIDHYKGFGKDYDYLWEERWVRDEGYGKIIPQAIQGFLKKYGASIADFDKVIYPCYFTGTHREIAKRLGIDPSRVQDNLHTSAGIPEQPILLSCSLPRSKRRNRVINSFWQASDRDAMCWASKQQTESRGSSLPVE